MPQICNMGQTALLPLRRKACCGFFRPKNPTASAGFEPAILGIRGRMGLLGFHRTDFHENEHFSKIYSQSSSLTNYLTRITATLHEDLHTLRIELF
jgi:hypothetical protein